ncbi:MAG: sugar ABC transporter permease [Spirochaetaceae bacterium]|jgi:raffinose/stachyose/melibiose transport system permease protein|nr:sugar ABC transporter permease [Spirochaetaceae bacterium]
MTLNTGNWHKYMALPAFFLFFLFFLFPLLKGMQLSVMDWDGFSTPHFVGLQNFIDFFHDKRALGDVRTTLLFALGSAPLLNIVGLGLALFLNQTFRGRNGIRTAVYLPAVISPMIMGSVWYLLLQPGRGLAYLFAEKIPFFDGFVNGGNWMLSGGSALSVIVLVNVWQFAGMTMVIYLAGLQSIPVELYEAASVEGSGVLSTFRYVTLPQLLPSIRINVITNIIGSLSVFEAILALTDGGPGYATESLSIYILRMCYGSKTGYSTAVALVLFVIILIPVLISFRFFQHLEDK